MLNLMIIVGSVRPGRIGLPVANWVHEEAKQRSTFAIDFVDLLELGLPMMNEESHPSLRQYMQPHTLAWSDRVMNSDAFIFVTPEYNSSYSPAMKNSLDYLFHEWHLKPAGFVCYGGASSGTRAVASLLPTVAALGMYRINPVVEMHVPLMQLESDTFIPNERDTSTLGQQLDRLVDVANALKPLRKSSQ